MRIFKIETQFVIYAYPVYNAQPVSKLKSYDFFVSWRID